MICEGHDPLSDKKYYLCFGFGINSIFKIISIPSARRCNNRSDGLRVPFSNLLIKKFI